MYDTHPQELHTITKSNMSHTHPSAHTPTCVCKSNIYYIHLVNHITQNHYVCVRVIFTTYTSYTHITQNHYTHISYARFCVCVCMGV